MARRSEQEFLGYKAILISTIVDDIKPTFTGKVAIKPF